MTTNVPEGLRQLPFEVKSRAIKLTPSAKALRARLLDAAYRPESVLFLDIETTGLSRFYHSITLVGTILNGEYRSWLAGDEVDELHDIAARARTLVTFNGSAFDLPFLKTAFPDLRFPTDHVDLRYAVRHTGLTGGQKIIERQLALTHRRGLEDVDGAEAVLLWHRYLRGETESLRRLIRYNQADVEGMRHIADHVRDYFEQIDPSMFTVPFVGRPANPLGWACPDATLPVPQQRGTPRFSFENLFGETRAANAVVTGIDLTGSETRPTGYATARGCDVATQRINTDDDIVAAVLRDRPELVSIDSPLCLPRGRVSVFDDDPGRDRFGILRQCERTLKRRGINVYPCLLPSMQRLTARGIGLAARLRALGYPVIESYPGAAQDIVGIPRKGAGVEFLAQGLSQFGYRGDFERKMPSHDELDAITCTLVGSFFLAGLSEALGDEHEAPLIVPSLSEAPGRTIIGISGRIAAGKTTLARMLRERGFAYARYSEVVDDVILAKGETPDRSSRQVEGWRLHREEGQRWMGERLLERIGDRRRCVIDGLRFPDDHAFLAERAGGNFIHVHVDASDEQRRTRYLEGELTAQEFSRIDNEPVEGGIVPLRSLAMMSVRNDGTMHDLAGVADEIVANAVERKRPG
ncbi:ribonuclease H-like domain-containing protein [Sphingomonas sp. PAMC 26605]|uniref:ribonuclease H-like domain-containing protein n=1 Tax=Sphingomonas sp. PAMC 26605 TaxID=1112214 RepID=UPI00026CD1E8|nr:ribonuclease H-like domain-containing protein [Sphingomonas sp. PAMC 26605]